MKIWAGRFRKPQDPEFERWQRSFPFDQRLIQEELSASRAHARALASAGVLSQAELDSILRGLDQVGQQAANPEFLQDEEAEDVHHFVEKGLVGLIGETGYKLHSGRSRNEQIATDLRLYVRRAIDNLQRGLGEFLEALIARAEKSGVAAMPSYTHLQPAEPVLVAHWLLAYAEMFFRDFSRLTDCRKRLNQCPLGSGAVAGTTLPLDRAVMAADLEFDQPTANSLDATSDRDFAIEFVQALALVATHLSRFAEEMVLFATREFGFVRLPEAFSTGSSAMPQKQNPDAMELIRGKAARVIGDATSLVTTVRGLPLAYNKDLQETQEPVFSAAETMQAVVSIAAGFISAVEFDYDRMHAAASSGFMNAMAAAHYLVGRGVPFRHAHEQIGKAVQWCLENHCELQDLSLIDLHRFAPEADQDFYSHLTLDAVLGCHDVEGGTAPVRVRQALAEARERLAALRGELHAHA
ncbi:MAG TPA: argininosuccinate lyase [Terriglobales bacterium]|nr:argininosuccinate lyase [Terriglobales bacterium]